MFMIAALHVVIFATGVISDYRPSWAVRAAHNIPHLNYDLNRERNDWSLTSDSLDLHSRYIRSIISPAVIFLSIGLAFLGATLLFWALQYHGGISTLPSRKNLQETPKRWAKTVTARKVILDRAFVTLLLLTFTAISASLYGFSKVESAVPGFKNVAIIFQAIDINGAAISADSESLVLQLTQSDCAQIQDDFDAAYSAAAAIATAGSLIVESVDQVIPELDAIAAYAQEYIKYSFIGAGVCFFLVIIIVMVYAIGMSRGMKSLLYWNVVLSLILYGLLLTFCSVAIVPIVALGDFCMSPMSNLNYFLPPGGDLARYANCTAADSEDSLQDPLFAAYSYSQSVAASLENIQYACPDDEYVLRAGALHGTIRASIQSLNSTSSCALVRPYLQSALDTSLCTNAVSGYVIIWVCYCTVTVTIYFTCVVVGLLFEYFQPRYWVVRDRVKSAIASVGYARRGPKSYMHVDGMGKKAFLTACEIR